MRYTEDTLKKKAGGRNGILNGVSAAEAGWEHLHFQARRLERPWEWSTDGSEAALVLLGGRCTVRSSRGTWEGIGRRPGVFEGMPYAVYLPPQTSVRLEPVSDNVEIACGWAAATREHPARLIPPEDCAIEIRGGGNATRQINSIIPPGFPCQRLVVVEVYTPGGNWSSYPPHKHDEHREDAAGNVLEADLEEIYFYKTRGFALQRIYNRSRTIDCAVVAEDNDLVLVPEGYHPVCAAFGYPCYYLNVLAGSAQSLANSDDPQHAGTRREWDVRDPRVPMVSHAMEAP